VRLKKWIKMEPRVLERMKLMEALSRRRDSLLESPELDLSALRLLARDYESAGLLCAAADLRSRVEWYEGMGIVKS
jgi:hypothetical protein